MHNNLTFIIPGVIDPTADVALGCYVQGLYQKVVEPSACCMTT